MEVDQRVTIAGRVLGTSNGAADQVFQLPAGSVDAATLQVQVEESGRGYQPWSRVDDLAAIHPDPNVARDATAYELAHSVHYISRFSNGADRSLDGEEIADPTDAGATLNFANRPLFGSGGPQRDDVVQGAADDGWLLAPLGAAAKAKPDSIRQSVASLGDGTYAVRLFSASGGAQYYRVDADLSVSGRNLAYAAMGHDDSLWAAIIEKAFTHHSGLSRSASRWLSQLAALTIGGPVPVTE